MVGLSSTWTVSIYETDAREATSERWEDVGSERVENGIGQESSASSCCYLLRLLLGLHCRTSSCVPFVLVPGLDTWALEAGALSALFANGLPRSESAVHTVRMNRGEEWVVGSM